MAWKTAKVGCKSGSAKGQMNQNDAKVIKAFGMGTSIVDEAARSRVGSLLALYLQQD